MKNLIVYLFLLFSFTVLAQPKGANVTEKDGVECYVHIIKPGNTLYGLHRLYNTTIKDIIRYNPNIEVDFKEGDEVIIPLSIIKNQEKEEDQELQVLPKFHKVESKETLYGISRKYGTTIDYLKENNEVLKEGLKPGQKIIVGYVKEEKQNNSSVAVREDVNKIKKDTVSVNNNTILSSVKPKVIKARDSSGFNPDVIVKHRVLEGETLYSISKRYMIPLVELYNYNEIKRTGISEGDVINVPVITENGSKVSEREVSKVFIDEVDSNYFHDRKKNYKIAVLLPFFLDDIKNDTLPNKDFINVVSGLSTDFLMGFELALDSLEVNGVSSIFKVYDTKNDSSHVASILDSLIIQGVDLVVGPFFPERIAEVASWSYDNKVKMICPVSTNTAVLKGNPFVDIAISSDFTLIEALAKYTISNRGEAKVVLVNPNNDSDKLLYDHYRETYLSNVQEESENLVEASLKDFKIHIQKTGQTILVFPSTDEGNSLEFVSDLMSYTDNRNKSVKIFSTKEWLSFENMKGSYMNKFEVHFAAPNDFNFKDSSILEVARDYREVYNTDLTKISALGFDIASYISNYYLLHNLGVFHGVMGDIKMVQKGEGNGFENNSVRILYQKDYEIFKVEDDK
jgi:LysM repeat protein